MRDTTDTLAGIRRDRIEAFATREAARYARSRPKSRAVLKAGAGNYLDGVPMHWMRDWPMPHPLLVAEARGARLTDIDGFDIDDFCLGDTGSLFGHSPEPVAKAIRRQAKRGLTYMLPTEDAMEVGRLLSERFGPFRWQIATTASDANRFALRVARAITGRPKVLVFDGCYHGAVDEAFVTLDDTGRTGNRPGLLGQAADLSQVAVAARFNDIDAVEAALQTGEIAAILTEPVMTNCAMVLPRPGFLEALRRLATRHDAILIIDETHTISTGPGGYSGAHGLQPDMLVIGKSVAGGMPAAVWGMTEALAQAHAAVDAGRAPGPSGMGTTLSANPMQFACLRATLAEVMTVAAFVRMERGAARLEAGLAGAIARHAAPWHALRVGARVEFVCAPGPLYDGTAAAAAHQPQVEAAIHTALVNRGCLIAPFHNMMLVSPVTKKRQIDRLIAAFDEILADLFD